MTHTEIKNYAEKKGLTVVEYFPNSSLYFIDGKIEPLLCRTTYKYEIGIELTKHAYFWWYTVCSTEELDIDDEYLLFKQRYNQNTGRVTKGFKTGYNAGWKIKNALNN